MRETRRVSRKAATSRRREFDCDAIDDYDWDNALVASDSASVSASVSPSVCPDRSDASTGGVLGSYLRKENAGNLSNASASVSSFISPDESRSQSTSDSDKAKAVPEQLMRIAEEPEEDIVFERSFHSPLSRHFAGLLQAQLSPSNAVFKPSSPAKSLSRFPFEDLSLGEGNSRSSYQEDDSTEQRTEIAGNLTRMQNESLDTVTIGSIMTDVESEPKSFLRPTEQEKLRGEEIIEEYLNPDCPEEHNADKPSPKRVTKEPKTERDKHRVLSVPAGSADSTAPLESFDHSEARKGFPHGLVLVFFLLTVVVLAIAIGFVVVARMTLAEESSVEPSPEAKIIQDVALSVSGPISLSETDSPQFKAFNWLTTEDRVVVAQSRDLLVERYIVTLLYFATGGEAWSKEYKFLSEGSVCGWKHANKSEELPQGIVCDDQLKVKHINLAGNNLGGTIPWEIALLDSLQTLDLSRNYIQGEIPRSFDQLRNLKKLSLESNMLEGQIPSVIGSMTGLVFFDVSSNHLTGSLPSEIGNMMNLEHLGLGNNKLQGSIPESFTKLLSLVELNIFRNEFSGAVPSAIGDLPRLVTLNFASNDFVGDISEDFCRPGQEYESLWADCRGESPLVRCSCCTICCEQNGGVLVC